MTTNPSFRKLRLDATLRVAALAFAALAIAASPVLTTPLVAAESAAGVISGIVTNKTTGNGLIGAKVEITALNLSALVDDTGRYMLRGVPAGTHELVVTYTGLDTQRSMVLVSAGQPAVRDFEMSSTILMLDTFKVVSEKAGLSSALTQQRNADNLKNVASMDALVDLPNMNATELAIRLPGVAFGNPGDEVVEVISVRGMGAGMSSITIDGGGMSSFSAQNRNTRMTAFTGAMFEALEVVKGQTPDKPVDSLGGGVNFKTRSPLSMREKRRITVNLTGRVAPSFTEQVPLRSDRPAHALFNAAYIEKFAVFGSSVENLAVSVNAFYSENAFGFFRTQRDYQQTNVQPAYLWDYRTTDNYNNRKQRSLNTKWDYRFDRNNLLKLNLVYNDAPEPMRRQYVTRAFTGSQTTVPNATTSGIVPGWTDRITTVRAVPTAANATSGTTAPALIDVTSTLINRDQRLRHIDLAGEHTFSRFELEWAGLWSRTRYRYLGAEGALTNRLGNVPFRGPNGRINNVAGTAASPLDNIVGPNGETGVGWILDRTQNDLYPRFIQNGGLDFTNPAYYRPSVNGLSTQSGNLDIDLIKEARAHLTYKVPIDSFSLYLKTGGQIRDHTVELERRNRRWSYIGLNALPADPSILLWDKVKTGRNIPTWEGAQFIQNGQPTDPSLWQEDLYFYHQNRLSASNKVNEVITGSYIMARGRIGQTGFLGGIRREVTETTGISRIRARVLTTAAQQAADPLGSAERDYAQVLELDGKYNQNFPSFHAWRDITPNLKLRGSWSTSFGRPSMANALPSFSFSDTNQTVSIGNPALLPQKARNWDFGAEYYFEPAGSFSVGWFHKTINDFILTGRETGTVGIGPDNGFDGLYEGYRILQSINAGSAITQGWEFAYQQQFRFLPGLLRTLRFGANFTVINTHGNFGTTGAYRKNAQVPGFIPRTGNLSVSWDYRKFGVSLSYNYTSQNIRSFDANQPSRNQYMSRRDLYNLNLRYQLRSNLTATVGIANLFNEPQRYFRGIDTQMEQFLIQGTTMTVGLEGRF
ncbi:MAG: TonB-dependent receptor [Verrucomicrobia bacterium]|nr:TonB-dependent receptor [Verrucomicrobiota bacterium]